MPKQKHFNVGDWIVHTFHGVGKVEKIVKKQLDDSKQQFYKVSTNDIDYWLPFGSENVDHIEPLRSKKDFAHAIKILSSQPEPLTDHHKGRTAEIHERWQIGTLESRAELLRDLNGRDHEKKLNFNEKELMEKITKYMISEWLICDSKLTRKKAQQKISKALNQSLRCL